MFLAQMPTPQLPPLPEGPALDRVRGPIEIQTYEPWQIWLAVAGGLILLGLIIWWLMRAFKKPTAKTPPYDAALAELDATAKLTTGDDKRFAMLTSQALRRYLEDALGLSFSSRTSEEFLRSIKGNTLFDESFQSSLSELLTTFDRIKFAHQSISLEERIQITDTVRSLIDQAHTTTQTKGAAT
ncbi:MAG: hypothetical protein ACI9ZV_000934 [Candidatus Azotimanducaceae bacterium]|jgi:hypothetical protein